jgi:glutamate racemase
MRTQAAIGVFDSGVGGLTVVRSLTERLPKEEIVYLGDTARVPYGSKSAETVARYSRNAARFLVGEGVKMIVIACNTASAFALDVLRAELALPVLGAVEPGARAAVAATRSGRIGVIGTLGTVRSGSYVRAIAAVDAHAHVTAHACPLFVPLAEEGWLDDDVAAAVARRYLRALALDAPELDVLVLGCTHYPLLRAVIEETLRLHDGQRYDQGQKVRVIDSAQVTAAQVAARLALDDGAGRESEVRFYATDSVAKFRALGTRFLGRAIDGVELVDLDR